MVSLVRVLDLDSEAQWMGLLFWDTLVVLGRGAGEGGNDLAV